MSKKRHFPALMFPGQPELPSIFDAILSGKIRLSGILAKITKNKGLLKEKPVYFIDIISRFC